MRCSRHGPEPRPPDSWRTVAKRTERVARFTRRPGVAHTEPGPNPDCLPQGATSASARGTAMSHDAFLNALRNEPEDPVTQLVWADWLTDHGRDDEAEFIRVGL